MVELAVVNMNFSILKAPWSARGFGSARLGNRRLFQDQMDPTNLKLWEEEKALYANETNSFQVINAIHCLGWDYFIWIEFSTKLTTDCH